MSTFIDRSELLRKGGQRDVLAEIMRYAMTKDHSLSAQLADHPLLEQDAVFGNVTHYMFPRGSCYKGYRKK